MLLSNEAELLAMEAEKYSGLNPIVVDNNNLTIGLDSGFINTVSSISGAISGLDNKLDISAFTGYSATLDSGLTNAFETVHNDITGLQNDDSYLSGMIDNKLDISAFTGYSASLDSALNDAFSSIDDKINELYDNDTYLSGSIDYLSGFVTTGLSAYSAGPNINITDYVISGKDWLDTIQEASAYAAQQNPTSSTEWNEAYETLTSNSGAWNSVTSIQGEIDYVSGTVDNKLDFSAFSDVSGTFLTAHQPISADEWNSSYETVLSNSASWSETFTGVTTDSTLTGNGKDTPLGVAEVQTLSSDETISITSANDVVTLGVNGTWFNNAVNSAVTGYATTGDVANKLDITAFSTVSGDFATTGDLQNYATTAWVSNINTAIRNDMETIATNTANNYSAITSTSGFLSGAIDNKLDITAFNIPTSSNWDDVYNTVNSNSGLWSAGDTEVNNVVYNNSGTWNTVTDKLDATAYTPFDPTYISGVVDNKLDTTAFSDVSGTFLTAVDLSNYYTKSETSGATELANAFANIPAGDAEVNNYVQTNSGTIDETVLTYQTNSGSYLTAHQPISANEWNDVYETVETNSASWGGGGSIESYNLSAGNYINITKDDVNSAIGIEATGLNVTNWNSNYDTVTANSGAWGGTSIGLSAGWGIDIQLDNDAVWISATTQPDLTYLSGSIDYISGAVGDVESLLAQL